MVNCLSFIRYLNKLHCSKSKNDSSDRPASIFPQIQMENVLEIGHVSTFISQLCFLIVKQICM